MKRFLAVVALALVVVACGKKEFKGFAGLDIGADFASLPNAKDFTRTMDGEYNIAKYDLDDIGEVTNLNVTTHEGKISDVRFSSTKETNTTELESVMEDMVRPTLPINVPSIEFYNSKDENIMFIVDREKSGRGRSDVRTEYRYLSKDAILRDVNPASTTVQKQ